VDDYRLPSDHPGNFRTYLDVREAPDGEGKWTLLSPLLYVGNTDSFTVPAGFRTDFASVPAIFRSLVSKIGAHTKAAVLHDWLYHERPFVQAAFGVVLPISRKDADGIFLRAMRESGVGWWRRTMAYQAVRNGGLAAWNKARAQNS